MAMIKDWGEFYISATRAHRQKFFEKASEEYRKKEEAKRMREAEAKQCPYCDGTGKVEENCIACDGSGYLDEEDKDGD